MNTLSQTFDVPAEDVRDEQVEAISVQTVGACMPQREGERHHTRHWCDELDLPRFCGQGNTDRFGIR
jgi:hypothetical protein